MDNACEKSELRKTEPSVESVVHQERSENQPEQLLTPKSLANRYRFVDEIGHGAQGKIYRAVRLLDGKTVVIKQLNISSIKTWKEYELFHREAEVLSSLKIKGVAQFYDAIDCLEDEPPCSYIVQEYIEGVSLKKMLDDSHRFKVEDVYDILIQTLQILYKLHHHEPPVVHRDIKPSNLMISADENGNYRVTVVDFGAVANPQVQGGGSTVAGTYGYMPPEQLMGKPEPASDIYALGAVAVQLFSGKSPADIPCKDFRLIFEPEMQDKPHALVTTLRQMLEPKIENRLVDIPEIINHFSNYKKNVFEDRLRDIEKDKDDLGQYDHRYEERLKNLRYPGQDGSIELWQELPDSTPRGVPDSYKKALLAPRADPPLKVKQDSLFDSIWLQVLSKLVIFVCIVFFSLRGCFLILSTEPLLVNEPIFNKGLFFYVLAAVFGIFLYAISSGFKERSPYYHVESYKIQNQHERSKLKKSDCVELLKNGRKSIGVITDIEYLPVLKANVQSIDWPQFVCYSLPIFKVQYKFNPPDDLRKEDIVHNFYTHVEPENHYRVGDRIPILYQIEDKYTHDIVTSMPYPVPIEEDILWSNALYLLSASEGRKKYRNISECNGRFWDIDLPNFVAERFISDVNRGEISSYSLSLLNKDIMKGNVSFKDGLEVYRKCWFELSGWDVKRRGSCIYNLFSLAFPDKDKESIYKNDVLHLIVEMLKSRPIPCDLLEVLIWLRTGFYMSMEKPEESDDFDEIWMALIDLFLEKDISDDCKIKIMSMFQYQANQHSRLKLYEKLDCVDFRYKYRYAREYCVLLQNMTMSIQAGCPKNYEFSVLSDNEIEHRLFDGLDIQKNIKCRFDNDIRDGEVSSLALSEVNDAILNKKMNIGEGLEIYRRCWHNLSGLCIRRRDNCIFELFELAFPEKGKASIYKKEALALIVELLKCRPIPCDLLDIIDRMSTGIFITMESPNTSDEFNDIWDAIIELFIEPDISDDCKLAIIDLFHFKANRRSYNLLSNAFKDIKIRYKRSMHVSKECLLYRNYNRSDNRWIRPMKSQIP